MEKGEKLSDSELVKRTLDGSNDAYGELVIRTKNLVYSVICGIISDPYTAEDIAQDSYICGFLQLPKLSDAEKFTPWICGIARRKALHYVTRNRPPADLDELSNLLFADLDASPEESLLRREKSLAVRAAIHRLTEKNREVAMRFYYGGQSIAEIAERLSIPVGSVKSRLHEARAKLKGELAYMKVENKTLPAEFEKKIAEKILQLRYHYWEQGGNSERAETIYRSIEQEITALPESREKQSVLADLYLQKYWYNKEDEDLKKKLLAAAEEGQNGSVQVSLFRSTLRFHNTEETIRRITEEGIPLMEKLGYDEGKGELLFWRGDALFWGKRTEEALADFAQTIRLCPPKNICHAMAVSALTAYEKCLANTEDPLSGFQATAITCHREGTKLLLTGRPGFSMRGAIPWEKRKYAYSLLCNARFKNLFYDSSMEVGQTLTWEYGGSFTLVGKDENVSVPAGAFQTCLHLHYANRRAYDFHVWYAKNVGPVKFHFRNPMDVTDETIYELSEYEVNGSDACKQSSFFPLTVGNRWRYRNPALPDYLYQYIGYDVIWSDGIDANLAEYGLVNYKKNHQTDFCLGSEHYLHLCEKACKDWKIGEAIGYLQKAVRENSTQNAAMAALGGIRYLRRMEEYQKKGYHFCLSSYDGSYLSVKDGVVIYDENGACSFGPSQYGTRYEENRIFGVNPFRYLQALTGRIFDEKWIPGYSEVFSEVFNEDEEGDTRLEVSDGGTVSVKAGTFHNCIKVTLLKELLNGETNYFRDFHITECGKKEFWYAKGVGIVRFDCTWGDCLSSSSELVSYANPTEDPSYLPVTLGSAWEYEERHLTAEGYAARRIIQVPCGMNGKYFAHDEQEFVYLGTESEYEEFKKRLAEREAAKD